MIEKLKWVSCLILLGALVALPQRAWPGSVLVHELIDPFGNVSLIQHRTPASIEVQISYQTSTNEAAKDAALTTVYSDYDNVDGTNFDINDDGNESDTCTASTIDDLLDQPNYRIYECTSDALASIGLDPEVQGATVSKTINGVITQFSIFLRDSLVPGNGNTDIFEHVLRHELGHGLGLDHTIINVDPVPVMYPVVLENTDSLRVDDEMAFLSNYASNPSNPNTFFGGDGACIHGRVFTDVNGFPTELPGVFVVGQDSTAPANDRKIISTVSGVGYDPNGNPNSLGGYTLCFPNDGSFNVTHLTAQLCDIDLGVLGGVIECGGDPPTNATIQSIGGATLSILPNLTIVYEKTGGQYIHNDSTNLSPLFTGDFGAGSGVNTTTGDFTTNIDFLLDVDIVINLSELAGPGNLAEASGGCQMRTIKPGQPLRTSGIDLSFALMFLIPLGWIVYWRRVGLES